MNLYWPKIKAVLARSWSRDTVLVTSRKTWSFKEIWFVNQVGSQLWGCWIVKEKSLLEAKTRRKSLRWQKSICFQHSMQIKMLKIFEDLDSKNKSRKAQNNKSNVIYVCVCVYRHDIPCIIYYIFPPLSLSLHIYIYIYIYIW